jgi:hypothetical protein
VGALAAVPVNRRSVPRALRDDVVRTFHSALEWHMAANQVFQTVYYFLSNWAQITFSSRSENGPSSIA